MSQQSGNRRGPKTYFGIRILEPEKFIGTVIGCATFLSTIVYQGAKFYLQQEFNEKQHQSERACDNDRAELKMKIQVLESVKDIPTKEDLEKIQKYIQKSAENEKK